MKRLFLMAVALVLAGGAMAFLLKPRISDKFKIYFDEKLIAGKKDFLATPVSGNNAAPNLIIILADDLGQTDISRYGNQLVATPNIDAIGANGVTFTEGYITSAVCSPSRAGLLTGRYQQRFGHELQPNHRYLRNMLEYYGFKLLPRFRPLTPLKATEVPSFEDRIRQGLPPSEITLAELLHKYDYQNAIIGKWHLGAADFAKPCARGFDYQYGFYEAFTLYAAKKTKGIVDMPLKRDFMDKHEWRTAEGRTGNCAILRNCCERQEENKYLTDKLTDEALAFMDRTAGQPFFLYLPYNAPHAPLQAPQAYYNKMAHIKDPVKRVYAAMIASLDDQVGRVTQYLREHHLEENTLVVFLSDNGGAVYNGTTDNAPYRGGKLTNFEGGIRVPFMMQWKGKINPGVYFREPVISLDIFATVAANFGLQLPADRVYDGVNLIPFVNAQQTGAPHQQLCWRSDFNKAIRKGDWKLLVNEFDNQNQLFNLREDPSEQRNRYATDTLKARELNTALDQWEAEMIKPLWPRVVNYVYKDAGGKYTFAF
ncbi:MAG: sulfatase-like hydrolase/transferase [Chitinophagales bacterium]